MFNFRKDKNQNLRPRFVVKKKVIKQIVPVVDVLKKNYPALKNEKTYLVACALLFNLSYRFKRNEQTIKKNNRSTDSKYDKPVPEKTVFTPLKPDYYSNPRKYEQLYSYENKYGINPGLNEYMVNFRKIIESAPHLTYRRVRTCIEIFKELNMIDFNKGSRIYQGKNVIYNKVTKISLKDPTEWGWSLITNSDISALKILLCFKNSITPFIREYTQYDDCLRHKKIWQAAVRDDRRCWTGHRTKLNKRNHKLEVPAALKNKGIPYNYVKASDTKIEEVKIINNFLEKKNLSEAKYIRSFVDNEKNYGRLYGAINILKKKYRQILIDHYDYKEIDFSCFLINLLKLILTGSKYDFDPYNKIVSTLFDFIELPLDDQTEELCQVYRKVIKKCALVITGSKSITQAENSIREKVLKVNYKKSGLGLWATETKFPYPRWHQLDLLIRHNILTLHEIPGEDDYLDTETEEWGYVHKNEIFTNHHWKEFLEENNFNIDTPLIRINEKDLVSIIISALPEIKNVMFSDLNGFCQNIESNIAVRMAHEIISKDQIPLLIHDAFLVKSKHEDFFNKRKEEILIEEAKKRKIPYLSLRTQSREHEIVLKNIERFFVEFIKTFGGEKSNKFFKFKFIISKLSENFFKQNSKSSFEEYKTHILTEIKKQKEREAFLNLLILIEKEITLFLNKEEIGQKEREDFFNKRTEIDTKNFKKKETGKKYLNSLFFYFFYKERIKNRARSSLFLLKRSSRSFYRNKFFKENFKFKFIIKFTNLNVKEFYFIRKFYENFFTKFFTKFFLKLNFFLTYREPVIKKLVRNRGSPTVSAQYWVLI